MTDARASPVSSLLSPVSRLPSPVSCLPSPVPCPLFTFPVMNLTSLGWDDFFANSFQPFHSEGFVPARVALEHKHAYELL